MDLRSPLSYPVPWKTVFSIGPNIINNTEASVDAFSAGVCAGISPVPTIIGLENLPSCGRFVLVANHYQRKGLWILHPASVITQAIRKHYGPGDPPVRWIVTANWPPLRFGPMQISSPGDVLLPRVARALACYPVSFAGTNQKFTARSIRRILREAATLDRPIGLFPEGVAGSASKLTAPLPGTERLLAMLARVGLPVQPVGISETDRFVIRFGSIIPAAQVVSAPDAAALVLSRVAELI